MRFICPKCYKINSTDPKLFFDHIPCKYCGRTVCCAGSDVLFDSAEEEEIVQSLKTWIKTPRSVSYPDE